MTRIKTSALVGAAALALALAGCGGGSSGQRAAAPAAAAPAAADPAPTPMQALTTAQASVPTITLDSDLAALQAHQAAQQKVVDAADALLTLLQSNPNTPHTDVDAARAVKATAAAAMMLVAPRITTLVDAAAARESTITDAKKALGDAETDLAALDADATEHEKLAAQQAVVTAADAVVAALEAEPTTTAAALEAAMAAAMTAEGVVTATMVRIETADSDALAMAIMVNANVNATDATKGGAKAPFHSDTAGNNYAVAVARKSAADATVTVTDRNGSVAYTDDDEKLGAGDAPPAIKGWHGAGFKRGSESAYVYTNIAAPTPIPFFLVENNGGRYTADVNSDKDLTTGIGASGFETLKIVTAGDPGANGPEDDAAYLEMWKSPALAISPSEGSTTTTTYADDTSTENIDEDAFRGTFDGALGEFECAGTDACTLTTNSKGVVTVAVGDWNFTPDTGVTVDKLDTDHLRFGYWLQTTPKDDGTSSYAFQAFSGGATPFGAIGETDDARMMEAEARMAEVMGSAKYTGAAGGMYVKKVLKSDGMLDTATNGMFTATASLTANFGGTGVAADDQFSISGMVEKFMDGDTDLGWMVKLMRADFVNRDDAGAITTGDPDHSNMFNGMTEGSAGMDNGQWRGTFHGPSVDNVDLNVDPPVPQMQPSGVAGEFNAHFTNGHVHGGFGATRTP